MLNFQPVRDKQLTLAELVANLTRPDLRRLTNEMVDAMLKLLADCQDADVVFTPLDAQAGDTYATDPKEVGLAWTLGHVIAHTTASAEEAAFTAAELARGVEFHGRSRFEVAWQTMTTINACRCRLEESRRMRLACLDVWPDEPHLTIFQVTPRGVHNAVSRFALGLMHDDSHLAQIADIVAQATAARVLAEA